jgi:hypothetical protein
MSLGEQDVLVVWIGATVLEHAMEIAKAIGHLSIYRCMA